MKLSWIVIVFSLRETLWNASVQSTSTQFWLINRTNFFPVSTNQKLQIMITEKRENHPDGQLVRSNVRLWSVEFKTLFESSSIFWGLTWAVLISRSAFRLILVGCEKTTSSSVLYPSKIKPINFETPNLSSIGGGQNLGQSDFDWKRWLVISNNLRHFYARNCLF